MNRNAQNNSDWVTRSVRLARLPGHPRGSALIIAMVLVLTLSGLCIILVNEMLARSMRSQLAQEDLLAFEAAEAGIDAAMNDINQTPTIQLYWVSNPYVAGTGPTTNPVQYISPLPKLTLYPTLGAYPVATADQRPMYVHLYNTDSSKASLYTMISAALNPYPTNPPVIIKPGCLGTLNWKSTDQQLDPGTPYARPMWVSLPKTPTSGVGQISHENNIIPQSLGDVAFFTYSIDWLWDGLNNLNTNPNQAATVGADTPIERNKYTIYSTGINMGDKKAGISQNGTVVTIEVNIMAKDFDSPIYSTLPLEFFVGYKPPTGP